MGRKLTPLAVALRAIEPLSDEEKQTVRDMLRPAPKPRSKSKPERKPSQKRKAGKEAQPEIVNFADDTDMQRCAKVDCRCWRDDNIHHKQTVLGYHEFVEPTGEAKGASG